MSGTVLPWYAVWKEICDGCHMNIPPQLYNELQKSTDPDYLSEL